MAKRETKTGGLRAAAQEARQPVAPRAATAVPEAQPVKVGVGTCPWAIDMVLSGHTVRRAGWTGNKHIAPSAPETRLMLTIEDLRAQDWRTD